MLKALCESYGERLCKETLFVVTIFISAGWWQDVADFTYNLILSSWHIKKSWLHHFCAEAINRTSLSSFHDIFSKWVEVQFAEWSLSWCVLLQTDHKMYFSSPSAESFVQQAQVPCTIRRIKLCSWTSLFQVFFFGSIAKFLSELWSGCYNSSFHDSKNSLKIDLSPCSLTDEVMRMRS